MNKTENSQYFDYSYFISMGGIGVLFSCAVFMIALAFGQIQYGYYGAGLVLAATGYILFGLIRKSKIERSFNEGHSSTTNIDTVNVKSKVGVAMLMTSPAGDVIYANKAAKILFEKHGFGEPQSPLKVDVSNKKSIRSALENLTPGKMKIVVVEVKESGKYLKLEVEKVHKNGDFYSWRIFEDAQAEIPLNIDATDSDGLILLGRSFAGSNIGFFAINENDKIIYVNEVFSKFLFPKNNSIEFPIDLSVVSQHSTRNLTGNVEFITSNGKTVSAFVTEWNTGGGEKLKCFLAYQFNKSSELETNNHSTSVMANAQGMENNFFVNSPIGIAVVSSNGKIHEKNIVFSNFLADLELEKNTTLADILTDDNVVEVFKEILKTLKSGRASEMIELNFKGLSEKKGQFYITRAGNDEDDNVIIYLIDITEQKSLELQFSQSQKMQAVGQLAGGVAHDFNNLLTAITGFCDLLLVKHGPGDQSFSDIIQIKQNANRAANLVRQLLAFSRQQTLRPKVLIMTDVVAELSNLLRRLIGSNIELEMNHGRTIDPVRVDQGQLEQVIINLCVNARDAMPDGGKLEIKTRNIGSDESIKVSKRYPIFPKGEYVLLEVNDNGTGIAKEHLDKVFEPFFSTKDVGKGTGLGLSTVYGIIKQTNGFVFPESEVGVGTSFKIYLPKHEEGEEEELEAANDEVKPEEQPQDLTGSSTILLVEDEDAVRMFASRALKNKGYTVYEADCGVSALKVLDETEAKIDLLISDVMMPQMDGPSLVKKIRETDKNLKVIFISGYAEDALDDNIMDKDFNFLSKPFSLKQLAEQVKEVLDK